MAAGEENIGAETSSIDPKVMAEPETEIRNWEKDDKPCFTAPTLFRGTVTLSSTGIPCTSALV